MRTDAAIVQAATWTAAAAAGYLVVRLLLAAARAWPGGARRAIGVGVVVAMTGGGVALAAPGDGGAPHPPAASVDWPTTPLHPRLVVVAPGDSLWTITARHLQRPTPAHVAANWPHWWWTNRRVVGRDPNLIHPGQRLRPPIPVRSRS